MTDRQEPRVLAPYGTEMARVDHGAWLPGCWQAPGQNPTLDVGRVAEVPLLPGGRNQTLRKPRIDRL